jgi:hypothetical protein
LCVCVLCVTELLFWVSRLGKGNKESPAISAVTLLCGLPQKISK